MIIPIKKVVAIIQKLAESPLKKPEMTHDEDDSAQMKTKMLEQTIFKIGTLLQRGFGELGASIISESLTQTDYGIDLSKPGRKVEIVYSICRIRKFTDTTECLQAEIMVFVNKIVRTIHLCAQTWDGRPTKNYGDRFMITWKLLSFDLATDDKVTNLDKITNPNGPQGDPSLLEDQRASQDNEKNDDVFGKAPGINDSANMTGKVDERTSLLPDGAPRGDKVTNSAEGLDGNSSSNGETAGVALTKYGIQLKREETVDKAFISAVKTLT